MLTSFQPNARKTLGKHESIKSLAYALEFDRTCCKTDSYIEFSYVCFTPLHKFCDLKAISAEIRQIPSSTLNRPVQDPKELLFILDGEDIPSPIHKDSQNNKEKEKVQGKTHFKQNGCQLRPNRPESEK